MPKTFGYRKETLQNLDEKNERSPIVRFAQHSTGALIFGSSSIPKEGMQVFVLEFDGYKLQRSYHARKNGSYRNGETSIFYNGGLAFKYDAAYKAIKSEEYSDGEGIDFTKLDKLVHGKEDSLSNGAVLHDVKNDLVKSKIALDIVDACGAIINKLGLMKSGPAIEDGWYFYRSGDLVIERNSKDKGQGHGTITRIFCNRKIVLECDGTQDTLKAYGNLDMMKIITGKIENEAHIRLRKQRRNQVRHNIADISGLDPVIVFQEIFNNAKIARGPGKPLDYDQARKRLEEHISGNGYNLPDLLDGREVGGISLNGPQINLTNYARYSGRTAAENVRAKLRDLRRRVVVLVE